MASPLLLVRAKAPLLNGVLVSLRNIVAIGTSIPLGRQSPHLVDRAFPVFSGPSFAPFINRARVKLTSSLSCVLIGETGSCWGLPRWRRGVVTGYALKDIDLWIILFSGKTLRLMRSL